jgi:hypothetical protein
MIIRLAMVSLTTVLLFVSAASAQFGFFDQMFQGQGQQQQHQEKQNVASDSAWYRQTWESGMSRIRFTLRTEADTAIATCSNYLCPDTLACVHFPHHCPCPFPDVEEKFELGDGIAVCASKGGYKAGETARKIELARKGLL